VIVMMPPLSLIFLVLGTIFVGIATPTEGGAMGASGALILALAKRRLNWSLLRQAMDSTAKLSAFVMFILIGSSVFTLTFRGVNGDLWVESLLTSLPGGQIGFLVVVNAMVFVLAFFLDYFELAFIVIPLLRPVADKLGIDLIWFGVLLGVNMQDPRSCIRRSASRSFIPQRGAEPRHDRSPDRPAGYAGHHGADLLGQRSLRHHAAGDGRRRHRVPRHGPRLARQGPKIDPTKIQIEVPQIVPNESPRSGLNSDRRSTQVFDSM